MADKYHVTYDSRKEDAFLIHTDQGIIKFVREGRLYTYEPSKKYLAAVKATNDKNTKKKRYEQFPTNHNALTDSLTDLDNTVKEQKQQIKENDTSSQTNTDDGEQPGNNTSTDTNNTQNSGTSMQIEPNSVKNNLSD